MIVLKPSATMQRRMKKMTEPSKNIKPGELNIDILVEDKDWDEQLEDAESLAERALTAAWDVVGSAGAAEVSVVLIDDARQQLLNRDYRGFDKPTNVLAFSTDMDTPPKGAPRLLGDITIAYETTAREAEAQDKSLANHFSHLLVHGMLHLVGFDHESKADAEKMERMEIAVLDGLSISDPYSSADET